jgi:hypothetical protein
MRHSLVGYLVAVILGAVAGTFTAVVTAHAFPANDGVVADTVRDALKESDQTGVVQGQGMPLWQDLLELATENTEFPVEARNFDNRLQLGAIKRSD